MTFGLLHPKEAEKRLVDLSADNYILSFFLWDDRGLDAIEDLEETFFTPGTIDNNDFTLMGGPEMGFAIVPRTDVNWRRIMYILSKHNLLPLTRREQQKCNNCGERDPSVLVRHHIVPRSLGGSDNEGNLTTLCANCHRKVHSGKSPFDKLCETS